ncbi:amidohydrolase family protein [Alteraurantiacibacter aestuarii]|uniref:Amidohydrolase family protein n=1 Tax=Alteraurantiacibacter aestuarii TaxID=650004 RepID=A0A844ZLT7_9SPHN|nr:amidohydrolase family protein [Alteraurantiacibacter aestuarii]MXO88272.1 amidohydrolase family protein [Alteraurantiacibacter aestuarii]
MTKLEDGSEKGLKGHFKEDFSHRTRIGLAPRSGHVDRDAPYKRIAIEEAWTFPALVKAQVEYLESGEAPEDDSLRMAGMFAKMPSLQDMLQDLGELRISHMDELGIDRQLLLLTAPGVQVVRPGEGTALARQANDIAAAACRKYPDRFSACAAFDPRDVEGSVKELERAAKELKLNGAVLNSHFQGHYLDEPEFAPILEALEANDLALYIHPTAPFNGGHYEKRGFFGALGGFPHDVWLHTMGLIMSGAFDRFPKLRLVIGHMGECMPLQLYRFDWMQGNADGRPRPLIDGGEQIKLQHPVSHYFRNNIWITTSGVAWEPAIKFCQDVLGPDRVIYAMDYPYQQSYDEVAAYDRMDMDPKVKKMLMEDNARAVFRITG